MGTVGEDVLQASEAAADASFVVVASAHFIDFTQHVPAG